MMHGLRRVSLALVAVAAELAPGIAQTVVRGPYLQSGSPTAVTVRWRTDIPADSEVIWSQSFGFVQGTATIPGSRTEHAVRIAGLIPDTVYWYSVGTSAGPLVYGPDQWFRTPPPIGARRPVRAWILGDSGTAGSTAARVRDAYLNLTGARPTDLWLMLGDNAYPSGTDAEYQAAVFAMYPGMLRRSVLWPTIGNHDAISTITVPAAAGVYYDIFDLPAAGEAGGLPSGTEGYYSFDHANVHFVCLNSAQGDVPYFTAMAAWLQADLAATAQEWVVAFWHHPPYSKGSHDSDTEALLAFMRQVYVPILEAGGVDLVLTGHSHSFERSRLLDGHYGPSPTFAPATMAPDPGNGRIQGDGAYRKPSPGPAPHEGAVHVVAGSSGTASGGRLDHPVMIRNLNELGSCVLEVWGAQLDLVFIDDGGSVGDWFTMTKGGATPVVRGTRRPVGKAVGDRPVKPRGAWRYHDLGVDLGTAWTAPAFDDAAWLQGAAPLGYGDPGIVTTVWNGGNPANVHPTTYFRKKFTLGPDPAELAGMRLTVWFNDGFVAHLNGVEVARSPTMPAGPVAFSTLSASAGAAVLAGSFDLAAYLPLLVPGNNVLAIEAHQSDPSSPELVFDARLDLFTPGQIWRYDDTGTDLGSAWKDPAFDDSGWPAGPAPLGWGETWLSTVINAGPAGAQHLTAYFRKRFDVGAAPPAVERLRLLVAADDGFVAWLNGVEVARGNMPSGPASFPTPAVLSAEAGTPVAFDITAHAGLLLPAGNVLAIELHQASASSNDAALAADLEFDLAPAPYLPPCAAGAVLDAAGEPESVLFVNGTDGGFGRSVDVAAHASIEVRVETPTLAPNPPLWALAVRTGVPSPGEALAFPPGMGTFCFNPFLPGALIVASSIPGIAGLVPAAPLPWALPLPAGLPAPAELTLQAIVLPAPGFVFTTNAIRLRVLP